MRLWHKNLIAVLPRQQLVAQWRECCAIAKDWATKGKTNHILINRVMRYPACHLRCYTQLVIDEMKARGYKVMDSAVQRFLDNLAVIAGKQKEEDEFISLDNEIEIKYLFRGWHTSRYYQQCYYNLEEKYDCGGLSSEEWEKIKSNQNIHTVLCQYNKIINAFLT